MNSSLIRLIECLADGQFHSGEELGRIIGVSRAAVWKHLQQLEDLGLNLVRRKGLGYAIQGGLSLLKDGDIRNNLTGKATSLLNALIIEAQTTSTNQVLLDAVRNGLGHGQVCLAEQQTAGRGRRGRSWISPYAANIYLSAGWRFTQGVTALEGLSLAVGVAVCSALESLGYRQLQLKWPNDVLLRERKLAGILIELAGDVSGECFVIVGIGLNVRMPELSGDAIDQPWIDLASENSGVIDRNQLVAALINELLPMLSDFESDGFAVWKSAWEARNAFLGRPVRLITPASTTEGIMLGVSDSGGVRLNVNGEEELFLGGEISLRSGESR